MDHELSCGYVMMIDGSVQHTRIAATPYVYVWMECVCMATDTHQLWIYLWILTGHRAPLSRGFAYLYSTEQHAARNHDSSHYCKCKGGSQLQPLWVGPYGHNTGKLLFLSRVFQAPMMILLWSLSNLEQRTWMWYGGESAEIERTILTNSLVHTWTSTYGFRFSWWCFSFLPTYSTSHLATSFCDAFAGSYLPHSTRYIADREINVQHK